MLPSEGDCFKVAGATALPSIMRSPAVIQVEGNLDGIRVLRHVQFRPEVAVLVQPLRVWLRVVDPLGAWEAFRQKAQAKEKKDGR